MSLTKLYSINLTLNGEEEPRKFDIKIKDGKMRFIREGFRSDTTRVYEPVEIIEILIEDMLELEEVIHNPQE